MPIKRKEHDVAFKATVALEAIKSSQSLAELSRRFDVEQELIASWREQLLEKAGQIFENENERKEDLEFHARIGEFGKKWRMLI